MSPTMGIIFQYKGFTFDYDIRREWKQPLIPNNGAYPF